MLTREYAGVPGSGAPYWNTIGTAPRVLHRHVIIMSTSTTTPLLDFVVTIPNRLERWKMLDVDEPLSQLHSRFWGTSMVDEEEAWRAQRPTSDSTSDSEEDEIKPGCYVSYSTSTALSSVLKASGSV
jgi:hypothetical protein